MMMDNLRAKAAEMGIAPGSIDRFSTMDRETLILHAALLHSIAVTNQNQWLSDLVKAGETVQSLLRLCRENDVEIPIKIVDEIAQIIPEKH